jgi:hypothetical protein
MDVYGTSAISNMAVIFKMATKIPKKLTLPGFQRKIDIQGKHDVTSSSMTSKMTTELHFQKAQG